MLHQLIKNAKLPTSQLCIAEVLEAGAISSCLSIINTSRPRALQGEIAVVGARSIKCPRKGPRPVRRRAVPLVWHHSFVKG